MFICIYFATTSGYYEYKLREKSDLTEDAIRRFEKDVKEGKNVDINDYLDNTSKDYNNGMSNFNKKLSNGINKIFSESLKFIFKSINDAIEN